jgi:tripartite-type tricarboxylate transporter receptor subunit TctC
MFKSAAGVNIQHVPYRGSAPAVTDLVGGQIDIMFDPLQSVLSNVQGGRLRAVALSGRVRSPVLPDVPTIAESGYADFETTAWWGVFAPARLPNDLAAALADATAAVVRGDAFRGKLEPLGVLPQILSRDDFADFQRRELAKWGKAVRESGATMD